MESLQLVRNNGRTGEISLGHYVLQSPIANREKLELLENLMSQEKLADLLQTFAAWVANHLPVYRIAYRFMAQHMKLLDTPKRGRRQSFTLQDGQSQFLGQLEYELPEILNLQQKRKLQQLHQLLIQPLRLFLRMEQMDQQSRLDHLTGIGNRAALEEAMARAIEHNLRVPDGLILVLLDLDHFKQINDTHGHPVGDKVLQEFATVLTCCIRRGDQAFRLGGDEFALLLQPADEGAAERVHARIKYHLAHHLELQALNVGTSLGYVSWEKGMDAQTLYKLADQQLYDHKRARA